MQNSKEKKTIKNVILACDLCGIMAELYKLNEIKCGVI